MMKYLVFCDGHPAITMCKTELLYFIAKVNWINITIKKERK